MRRFSILFLAVLQLFVCCTALAAQPAPVYPDRAWRQDAQTGGAGVLPSLYRTMLDAFPEKAEEPLPSREGMDTLSISGSGEFSANQFETMVGDIRSRTDAVICDFDLRQETHGFVNGEAVSLYAEGNAGNAGLGTAEVLALEKRQLGELLDTELTVEVHRSGGPKEPGKKEKPGNGPDPARSASRKVTMTVAEVMTEAELCASQDVRYVRIACTDHLCPTDEEVDEFLAAYQSLPEGAWLHFHCAAGVGRTGLFMMMTDMLRNPQVSLEDVIHRQVLLGAQNPESSMGPDGKDNIQKLDLLRRFHAYVAACAAEGYRVTFSEWCSENP